MLNSCAAGRKQADAPLEVTAPPAERVASGSPLEGGDNVGKAPMGLL